MGRTTTASSWSPSASIPGASIGRLSTRPANLSVCRTPIAIRATRPPTKQVVAKLGRSGSTRRPASSSWRSTRSIRSTRTSWPTRSARRGRSAAVHARSVPLLAQRRADGRSHDRLHEPNGRLPHRRLGPRNACRARSADDICSARLSPPGTAIGTLRPKLAEDTGLPAELACRDARRRTTRPAPSPRCRRSSDAIGVIFPAAPGRCWARNCTSPCVSAAAQAASFTNELGVGGTTGFSKTSPACGSCRNAGAILRGRAGVRLRRAHAAGEGSDARSARSSIRPTQSFQSPGDMLRKIADFARATNQPAPESPGQFVRCAWKVWRSPIAINWRRSNRFSIGGST